MLDIDLWIDLVLATDPALLMGGVLVIAIGLVYLLVFQLVRGRTLGMQVMKIKIIERLRRSTVACEVRRAHGRLSRERSRQLGLGFLWMGFDSEKRALQDWIAGTYVIRA